MFTVAYLRDRAIRFRDLAGRAGNFEDAQYLLELAADADRQAETHDQQAAQSEDPNFPQGPISSSPAGLTPG
jgi:hypothetical protein